MKIRKLPLSMAIILEIVYIGAISVNSFFAIIAIINGILIAINLKERYEVKKANEIINSAMKEKQIQVCIDMVSPILESATSYNSLAKFQALGELYELCFNSKDLSEVLDEAFKRMTDESGNALSLESVKSLVLAQHEKALNEINEGSLMPNPQKELVLKLKQKMEDDEKRKKDRKKLITISASVAGGALLILVIILNLRPCILGIHPSSEATCVDDALCKYCGKITAPALGHNATEATCTEGSICQRCNLELSKSLGHEENIGYCSRCMEYVNLDIYEKVFDHIDEGYHYLHIISEGKEDRLVVQTAMNEFQEAYSLCMEYHGMKKERDYMQKIVISLRNGNYMSAFFAYQDLAYTINGHY